MIKKAIIGTAVALVLVMFFFGRDAISYLRTSAGYVKDAVHSSVSPEFQIKRARGMIEGLEPEIKRNMHVIAKEEVELERLAERIEKAEAKLNRDKGDLVRLQTDLSSGQEVFVYAGRNYSETQVKTDLSNRFKRYRTNEATLTSLQASHDAQQRGLDYAREQLEGMLAAKRQLTVEVENLEAQLKMLQAAQTTSDYNFDDSKLARVKELVKDVQTRLDVAARVVDAEDQLHDQIPLEEPVDEDIVEQVAEYFGENERQLAQD